MPLASYPVLEDAIEGAKNCLQLVRAGEIIAQKELFALSAWTVQGYGQRILVGELPQAGAPVAELVELKAALMEPRTAEPEAMPFWLSALIDILVKVLRELLPD